MKVIVLILSSALVLAFRHFVHGRFDKVRKDIDRVYEEADRKKRNQDNNTDDKNR